jgi:hypothetical protein
MQTFYEDEAITIRPNLDGHLLSDFQHTLGDLLNNLWFERCAAFHRHVDLRDRKFFSPQHCTSPKECQRHATKGNNLSLRDVLVLSEILEPIRRVCAGPLILQGNRQARQVPRDLSVSRVCHIAAKTTRYCKAKRKLRSALGSTLSLARF